MPLFETFKQIDKKYTRKTMAPQYVPSERKPLVESLCNYEKYSKLIKHINDSNVSEEEKKFLKFGASRHLVFDYSLIADYYAHATPEMQKLMEESALVIIDFDDAIANGYVKLSKTIKHIMDESGDKTNEK